MSIDPDLFRATLGRFATGVTVITTRDSDDRPHGMTVSAFASLSLDPPLVLVSIAHDATMSDIIANASTFAVNVLAESQEELSRHFSDRRDDRFEGVAWTRGPLGDALLEGALAWLQCRIVSRHAEGDHTIYVGAVEAADAGDGAPLLYFRGGYARLER